MGHNPAGTVVYRGETGKEVDSKAVDSKESSKTSLLFLMYCWKQLENFDKYFAKRNTES